MTDERLIAWGDELIKLHNGFRAELAELRDTGKVGSNLRAHCLTFCDAIHSHHVGEDDVLFPHLAAQYPELADVLTRLRAEHATVARILAKIRALTGNGELGAELDRLAGELEAHLDYEEEQLVPVLNQIIDMPDNL